MLKRVPLNGKDQKKPSNNRFSHEKSQLSRELNTIVPHLGLQH